MHPEVESYLTQPDESLRRTGSMRAKTGRYTSCDVALRTPSNRIAVPGNLQFEAVQDGFVLPTPRSKTSALAGRRFGTHRLWQRQSEISGQWLCIAAARS